MSRVLWEDKKDKKEGDHVETRDLIACTKIAASNFICLYNYFKGDRPKFERVAMTVVLTVKEILLFLFVVFASINKRSESLAFLLRR